MEMPSVEVFTPYAVFYIAMAFILVKVWYLVDFHIVTGKWLQLDTNDGLFNLKTVFFPFVLIQLCGVVATTLSLCFWKWNIVTGTIPIVIFAIIVMVRRAKRLRAQAVLIDGLKGDGRAAH
jgi:hypothetical protein